MSTVESGSTRAETRLRVVADTNVFVSALQFGGAAEDVWLMARAGLYELFVSPEILEELAEVLTEKFRWNRPLLQEALSEIRSHAHLVRPREHLTVVRDDPSDDRILECAVEAAAHAIVTGDSHLRKLKAFRGIPIMSLAQFLESSLWAGGGRPSGSA